MSRYIAQTHLALSITFATNETQTNHKMCVSEYCIISCLLCSAADIPLSSRALIGPDRFNLPKVFLKEKVSTALTSKV